VHNFKELKVWQKSMEIAADVYNLTAKLPSNEKYGLISQINRSVISIPSNIAEGTGRKSPKEFDQFLSVALSSAFELETQILLAGKLKMLENSECSEVLLNLQEIQKMIFGLKKKIEKEFQEQCRV
jgi:four helix bundle protein